MTSEDDTDDAFPLSVPSFAKSQADAVVAKRTFDLQVAGSNAEEFLRDERVTSPEEFYRHWPSSFRYHVRDDLEYVFRLQLLSEIYRGVDCWTVRWMTEFYQDVKKLHPDQYLLNEQVPEKWFDVFDEIREKYPGAGEDQRRRFRAQVGFIQQKAQSTEWREYLIQYLKADLPEELSRLPGLLDERESILRNFLRDFGRVARRSYSDSTLRRRLGPSRAGTADRAGSTDTQRPSAVFELDDSRGESPAAGHKDVWALLDGLVHSWVLALRSRSWREFFYSGAVLALLVLIIISGSVCVGFAMSTARTPECGASAWDDNFYALLAQMLLLVYSLYLIVVPLSRNGVVPASGWWFWACLVTSAACSLASVAIYPFHWKLSTGLAYMSGAMQVTATVQLVEGLDKKMKEQDLPASTSS